MTKSAFSLLLPLLCAGLCIVALPGHAAVVKPAPAPSAKPGDLISGNDVEAIAALLREAGFKAQIKSNPDGIRYIDSAANGVFFTLSFSDCDLNNGCASLRFLAWWERPNGFTTNESNEWNAHYKLARAAIDGDGDLILDYYLSLKGGVRRENFLDAFDWWSLLLVDFRQFMDDKAAASAKSKAESGKQSDTGPDANDEGRSG
ncbi:YbjN domain-containing protein [Aquisediminimonas sediminicola]|uniref:YbjN domain-containing protein n=1 Tax=Alteraquisediminimonas sediminicola TaxID=2676787 RepID=UPI001C8DBDE4|nr:YbjN domain-containing protein [Aquisediminimonas sediminicola]